MKTLSLITTLIILASCSNSEKGQDEVGNQNEPWEQTTSANNKSNNSVDSTSIESESSSTQQVEEEDCVFNNDYKTLTADWLKEVHITDYIWDESLEQAKIPIDGDTILVSKGGCVHFGFLTIRRYYDTEMTIDEHDYWVDQAKEMANDFGFTRYSKMLQMDSFKVITNSKKNHWIEIEDDNFEDNLYYNGVELIQAQNYFELSISKYFN